MPLPIIGFSERHLVRTHRSIAPHLISSPLAMAQRPVDNFQAKMETKLKQDVALVDAFSEKGAVCAVHRD